MKKEPIEQLFNRLGGELDTASPSADHKKNFLAKLQGLEVALPVKKEVKTIKWMRPLFIAASLLLIAGLIFSQLEQPTTARELADVSPEMQQTQDFFTQAIERELFDIKANMTPENEKMVLDAITRLELLEVAYDKLKNDLSESGEDKRVIYAMIDNFQNRIDLLKQLVEQMETIKSLNNLDEPTILLI